MNPTSQVLSVLKADANVNALVSGRIHNLITPLTVASPKINFFMVSFVPDVTRAELSDFGEWMFQFNCVADSLAQASAICDVLSPAIEGAFESAVPVVRRDGYDDVSQQYVVSVDFVIVL